MIHQYHAQRSTWSKPLVAVTVAATPRKGHKAAIPEHTEYRPVAGARMLGTVPVGTIVYIHERPHTQPKVNTPWIVMAWLNREYHPAVKGVHGTVYMAGGHLAVVKSLRTGQVRTVSDSILVACIDAGLERVC